MSILKSLSEGVILPVYKPLGWTSFDVIRKIKGLTLRRLPKLKIGHAGTLDPLAEGVLVICTQKQTKQVDFIHGMPKTYIAKICLGATRPSYDKETEINERFEIAHIDQRMIEDCLKTFLGVQTQIPPVYSAIKQDGERIFLKARQGVEVAVKSREVEFYDIELISCELPYIEVKCEVSKGTYIRTLAFDIGKKLNSGAFLDHLVRTAVGEYTVENAMKIEELETEIKAFD